MVTSAGKSEFCTQAGDSEIPNDCSLSWIVLTAHANSEDKYSFAREEQRARGGGLRIYGLLKKQNAFWR